MPSRPGGIFETRIGFSVRHANEGKWSPFLFLIPLLSIYSCLHAGDIVEGLQDHYERDDPISIEDPPNFQRHIIPLMGRLGCNGRNCHGSFQGRGGFRLSMFGYDFSEDHAALVEGEPPRVNLDQPLESLILTKPTDPENHEGGQRFEKDRWEYRAFKAWIAAGAKNDSSKAGELLRIEVSPEEILFHSPQQSVTMRVVAVWSDGTREDVTCLSRFDSQDDEVATVDEKGKVIAKGKGDTHLIVSYDNAVDSTPIMMPIGESIVFDDHPLGTTSKIDLKVNQKLQKLGIAPSEVCTDLEFLRRVSLDIAGTLPSAESIERFIQDRTIDKRSRKIEELLNTPAYALWWSTKFCDFTGLNGPLQLGNTEFGPIVSEQWRSWLERKIRDNVPYDKMVEGMVVSVSRYQGQPYEEYARQMSSYTLTKNPVDFTERSSMPNFWFRENLSTSDDKALAFAYSFMGVRLDCAQCHKHPFDRWSQQDFKRFAALFDTVRSGVSPECKAIHAQMKKDLGVPEVLDTAAKRRQAYWRWAAEGKAVPWPEVYILKGETTSQKSQESNSSSIPQLKPKLLGGEEIDVEKVDDPRRPLMDWLRSEENPYFAKAIVNRVWAHYFGRGIVDPPDDLNLGNPPSNPELLDDLARRFVRFGFDLRWLHREITHSATYQRSWRTNESNRNDQKHFSHAMIRRLPAEVVVDAMLISTAGSKVAEEFIMTKQNRRIGVQATADLSRTEFALAVFGKPLRTINCDCEREQQPSLAQAIFVRNDQDLYAMFDRKDGLLTELENDPKLDDHQRQEELIRQLYLRTLSRPPNAPEFERAKIHLASSPSPLEGFRDLLWVLLNTQEFITNH